MANAVADFQVDEDHNFPSHRPLRMTVKVRSLQVSKTVPRKANSAAAAMELKIEDELHIIEQQLMQDDEVLDKSRMIRLLDELKNEIAFSD